MTVVRSVQRGLHFTEWGTAVHTLLPPQNMIAALSGQCFHYFEFLLVSNLNASV